MWVTCGLSHEKPSCQTTGNLKGILPKRTKESERMKFEYIMFEIDEYKFKDLFQLFFLITFFLNFFLITIHEQEVPVHV